MGSLTLVAIGLVSLSILGIGLGAFFFVNPSRSAQDRLQDLTGNAPSPNAARSERLGSVGQTIAKVAAPKEQSDDFNALKRQLIQAGYRSRNNVELYSAVRFSAAVLFPMLFAVMPTDLAALPSVGIAIVLAAIGYYVPALLVTNARQKRQEELLKTFPDALDMLTASVEAGLGLDASFRRIADEMGDAAPLLCDEFKLVNNEVSAGVPRIDALKNLENRTGLDEIASLVNVLTQAERFGTPVARSLRVHSEMTRTKRMQAAEENAAKISPKLTVAMILFMLPCLIIILIGPAIVNVVRTLLPAMAGQ